LDENADCFRQDLNENFCSEIIQKYYRRVATWQKPNKIAASAVGQKNIWIACGFLLLLAGDYASLRPVSEHRKARK
jgi:hypothetical protein